MPLSSDSPDEVDRLRLLAEATFEALLLLEDGVVVEANDQAVALLDYGSRAALLGAAASDLVPEADGAADAEGDARGHYRALARRADGSTFPCEVQRRPLAYGGRRLHVAALRDVTELARAEAAARPSPERLEALMDSAIDAIVTSDAHGTITGWNKGAERIFGYRREEILGRSLDLLMPARYVEAHRQGMRRVNETGETRVIGRTVELHGLRKSGREFPLELSLARWRADGEIRYTGIMRDVTERHEADAALRASRERLARAQAIAHIGSWEWDVRSGDLFWSDELYRIFGLEPGEGITLETYMAMIHPVDRERVQGIIGAAMEEGAPFDFHHRIRRVDGQVRIIHSEGLVLVGDDGRVQAMTGTAHDVTAQKTAEEELERANRVLRQRNRELQEFAFVASHDLREPLRKISSFASLLRAEHADELSETAAEYLDRMEHSAVRMSELIHDLLSFSRVATRARPFERVELEDVVRGALAALQVQLDETGAEVSVEPLPGVEADPAQLHKLVQNLVSNAVKFRKPGERPRISVRGEVVEDGQSGGAIVRLVVEDEGIGFEEKYLEKIFTPFQRLHGRSAYEGTGMGLAICRRVVERHGGRITAESTPGAGSRFIVELPARQEVS